MAKYDKLYQRAFDLDLKDKLKAGGLIAEIDLAEEKKLISPKERKRIYQVLRKKIRQGR